jgi:hypothetical protein
MKKYSQIYDFLMCYGKDKFFVLYSVFGLLWIFLFCSFGETVQKEGINFSDCTFNGHKLYGKIMVVTAFPDIKVQIVEAFPDIKVKVVDAFPDDCGKWKFVNAFPDTKIMFVDAFPDLKIKYVDAFPGKP